MYRKILVALENSQADASLLPHIEQLAQLLHSELLLVHVADGWVARNFNQLKLVESEVQAKQLAHSVMYARARMENLVSKLLTPRQSCRYRPPQADYPHDRDSSRQI